MYIYIYIVQLKFIGKAQLYIFKILSSGVQTNLLRLLITFFVKVVIIIKIVKKVIIRHRFTYNSAFYS